MLSYQAYTASTEQESRLNTHRAQKSHRVRSDRIPRLAAIGDVTVMTPGWLL